MGMIGFSKPSAIFFDSAAGDPNLDGDIYDSSNPMEGEKLAPAATGGLNTSMPTEFGKDFSSDATDTNSAGASASGSMDFGAFSPDSISGSPNGKASADPSESAATGLNLGTQKAMTYAC